MNVELPNDPLSKLSRSVFTINGLLLDASEAIAQPLHTSVAKWHVLARANYRPRTVSQIARYIGVSRQSLQRLANILTAEGLVTYTPHKDDKRAPLVTVTPKGSKLLTDLYAQDAAWSQEVLKSLDEDNLARLSKQLDAVSEILAAHIGRKHDEA